MDECTGHTPIDGRRFRLAAQRVVRRIVVVCAMMVFTFPFPGCERRSGPRNVLLISIDSLRADRLGCYGNSRETSPTMDRLAAEGIRFAHAVSPTSWTLPAHATLLTGRSQATHGAITLQDKINPSAELLGEIFSRHGYETVGFFSGPPLDPIYGFGRGFDSYISCLPSHATGAQAGHGGVTSSSYETNPLVAAAFTEWVGTRHTGPFFAFVHMWDVHFDYVPPEPYASMFDPGYTGPLTGRDINLSGFPLNAPPRDLQHLLALYDGEIRYTDATIAQLLRVLQGAGVLDETLVVITSDHGDEFLEHGGKLHAHSLFQELIHVPLIFWSRTGLPRGHTVPQAVSLGDVAPTILEMVGLPAPEGADGQSLLPLMTGRTSTHAPPRSALYAPLLGGRLQLVSAQTQDTKVILDVRRTRWTRYDLGADPREQEPAADPEARLQAAIERHRDTGLTFLRARARARKSRGTVDSQLTLPPELAERLRELGYLK